MTYIVLFVSKYDSKVQAFDRRGKRLSYQQAQKKEPDTYARPQLLSHKIF